MFQCMLSLLFPVESEGAVGGVNEEGSHVTGSDAGLNEAEEEEEEEVPIDEDLFATEDLDIENLDLEDVIIEPDAVD